MRKGCNFVIAVSVTAKMELEFADNQPDTPANETRAASSIETLLRSYLVQNHSVNSLGVQDADFVIEPDVTQFDLTAFIARRDGGSGRADNLKYFRDPRVVSPLGPRIVSSPITGTKPIAKTVFSGTTIAQSQNATIP